MTNLDATGKVKQDGKEVLTDYVNYNSTTNTFLAVSNHAIFNVGVASSTYSVNNIGEDSDGDLPIIKAKSGTLLEFRLDVTGEPFNIYIGDVSGTSGTLPEGGSRLVTVKGLTEFQPKIIVTIQSRDMTSFLNPSRVRSRTSRLYMDTGR